jgi:hypothetical protein
MRQAFALACACLVAACGGAPTVPQNPASTPAAKDLLVRGTLTVRGVTAGVYYLNGEVDGRVVGQVGGSDIWGSPKLSVSLGRSSFAPFEEAARIQAGVHEIVADFSAEGLPGRSYLYASDAPSRVEIVDRQTGAVLSALELRPQEVTAAVTGKIRWTIEVDAAGIARER